MNKLQKIALAVVLTAVALYGGLKGFVYYKIKDKLDNAVAMARPFVEIDYGGISSTLSGSFSIDDISILPIGAPDRLHIDSVRVEWPDPSYLFTGFDGAQVGNPPERMTLALDGLRLSLEGGLAAGFSQALEQAREASAGKIPDPCAPFGSFGPPEYRAIGHSQLLLDAKLSYDLDEAKRGLDLQLDYALHDIQTLSMKLSMTGVTQPAAMMMGAVPLLKEYVARFEADPDFVRKAVKYCAETRNQYAEEYIQSLVGEAEGGFAGPAAFVPGPGIRQAIRRYLQQPGEVLIEAHPPQPLDLTTLMHYKAEDIAALLGLKVRVSGEEVKDLSFSIAEGFAQMPLGMGSIPGFAGQAEMASPQPRAQSQVAKPRRPKSTLQRRYVATASAELSKHVGRDVRLFTYQRETPRVGVLVSVQDGLALVEQRVYRGTMSAYVPVSDIRKAEVVRLVRP